VSLVTVRPPLRLLRLGNPLVRAILRSPAHGLLSGRLILLEYRGRRTGRTFAIPLRYADAGDAGIVALAVEPRRKQWWRSFVAPRPAVVVHRGTRQEVVGTVAEGRVRDEARRAYVARYPGSAGLVDDTALVLFERSR
jgi:F420H(2)-dependent quinone reductase